MEPLKGHEQSSSKRINVAIMGLSLSPTSLLLSLSSDASPLIWCFPAFRTMEDKFLYKLPILQYPVMSTQNGPRQDVVDIKYNAIYKVTSKYPGPNNSSHTVRNKIVTK